MDTTDDPGCQLCGDTGWITRVDLDGSGYDVPCPEGCPTTPYLDDQGQYQEMPY